MGNPQVLAAKVAWDTLVYFWVVGLTLITGATYTLELMEAIAPTIARFGTLSHHMQAFFREWDELDEEPLYSGSYVDMSSDLFYRANTGLLEQLDATGLQKRLVENVTTLEQMAQELMAGAVASLGLPPVRWEEIDARTFTLAAREGTPEPGRATRPRFPGGITDQIPGLWLQPRRNLAPVVAAGAAG
jgi:hypothetical protein